MKELVIMLFSSITFVSCATVVNQNQDCMCTMVFVSVAVTVVDQNNRSVDSLNVIVKNKLTGKVYDFGSAVNYDGRGYLVMTDGYTKEFSTVPQSAIFTGKKGNSEVTGEFQIVTDDCKCHVNKASGPDTLRMTL